MARRKMESAGWAHGTLRAWRYFELECFTAEFDVESEEIVECISITSLVAVAAAVVAMQLTRNVSI